RNQGTIARVSLCMACYSCHDASSGVGAAAVFRCGFLTRDPMPTIPVAGHSRESRGVPLATRQLVVPSVRFHARKCYVPFSWQRALAPVLAQGRPVLSACNYLRAPCTAACHTCRHAA